jgi:hypothetical protein
MAGWPWQLRSTLVMSASHPLPEGASNYVLGRL